MDKSASRAVCKKQNTERSVLDRTLKEASLLPGAGGSEKCVFMCEEEHNRKIATEPGGGGARL